MATELSNACCNSEIDRFKGVYKKYKRRDVPLNVQNVIDLHGTSYSDDVISYTLHEPSEKFPGLKPVKDWKAYQLKNCEGFIVINNPFEPKYQRYWVERCLLDFPMKPNRTNLDAHMERPSQVWHSCVETDRPNLRKDSLLMKLRWATLGYQYEWNTKEYFADRVQSFPDDLSHLCTYIAKTLGYSNYSSEAGIVNYYRMESTLMGHTDVSELDKAAPLISFSFGQSCIFLIGGPTKETEPIPVFLNSGDICLMTGNARLSYHAVPRILPGNREHLHACFHGDGGIDVTDDQNVAIHDIDTEHDLDETENDPYSDSVHEKPPVINVIDSMKINQEENTILTPTQSGNRCSVTELGDLMKTVIDGTDWTPFQDYLNVSRVNLNVRQVLKPGLELGSCPDVIKPCDRSVEKT
ncbi:nucleic acid dioxygenase ALKBH1-like [Mya arenaria]|uniref:nucleic acid dioxygenase ALKBH1-like n=1 Tax=Mya arenaria TaxID=6604 RepID=UPI0022E72D6A|nr:nucleic acid dioxygenase ALKBH1-like [Mya arenaria]